MNTVKSNFSLNSFSDIEYRALNRLKNAKIDEDFQGELNLTIHRPSFCDFCISEGLIRLSTSTADQKLLTIAVYKTYLHEHHLKVSGNKQELINRINNFDSSFFGKKHYILTDKGKELLYSFWDSRENRPTLAPEERLKSKLNKYNIPMSIYNKHRQLFPPCYSDNDVIWNIFNDRILEYSFQSKYTDLRETYLNMALLLEDDKMYVKAFSYFCMTICFDINGYSRLNQPTLIAWIANRLFYLRKHYSEVLPSIIYSQCLFNKQYCSEENFSALISDLVTAEKAFSNEECKILLQKYAFSNPTTEEKAIYANQNKEEYSMANYVTITSDKRKKTALLLCVFLGMFGAHQYYVGKIGKGILYTCTFGLFGIGWIVDIFKIALGNFRDNTGAPLRQ